MLVDKFQFHIPLYRQHQRLESAQITLSRATLTNLTRRSIESLEPIADAQLQHILLSRVLAMDETPIKAGKSNLLPKSPYAKALNYLYTRKAWTAGISR